MHPYFDEVECDDWYSLEAKQVLPPWTPRADDHFSSVKRSIDINPNPNPNPDANL